MQKLLTISIAAYNQETNISNALDSIVDERIIEYLEVFIIDDGGTDKTLEIAQQYACKYPDSIFPIHKENGGYGTTINYGIEHASGKYIKLLDGDDWFDRDGLYQLVMLLKKTDVDVVITPYCEGMDYNKMSMIRWDVPWGESKRIEELDKYQSFGMWALTYKTQAVRDSKLKLPAMYYADQVYNIVPFLCCEMIYFLDNCVYCYRIGQDGQSISRSTRLKHINEIIDLCIWQCEFYEEKKRAVGKNLEYIARRIGGDSYQFALNTLLLLPVSRESLHKIKNFDKRIRSISVDIFRASEQYGRWKIVVKMLRKTGYIFYWLLGVMPEGEFFKLWNMYKSNRYKKSVK